MRLEATEGSLALPTPAGDSVNNDIKHWSAGVVPNLECDDLSSLSPAGGSTPAGLIIGCFRQLAATGRSDESADRSAHSKLEHYLGWL